MKKERAFHRYEEVRGYQTLEEVLIQSLEADQNRNEESEAEAKRKNDGRKISSKVKYCEPPKRTEVDINTCGFGDEKFFFDGQEGNPKYEDIGEKWEEFVQWIIEVRERNKNKEGYEKSIEYVLGGEIIKWGKKRDAFPISLLAKIYWKEFRDAYVCVEGCPEIFKEFVHAIMHKRMTEKQMWGTDEDRKPKGRLIIFDKDLLPDEDEDLGDLQVEYCPINQMSKEERRNFSF